ncbi:MAG TPA: hypothetical protein PKU91_03775, partial [Phycisphaerales bacterium]|nr:hypothetical protein [Phycisphaerales bacterium]
AGFPFTAGFFSKDMILAEAFVTPGMAPIGWLLLLTAGLTAYYTFRVFFRVFVGPVSFEPGDEVHSHAHDEAHTHGHSSDHANTHDQAPAHASTAHGHFHPHAPGWAINTVLVILSGLSIAAAGLYFMGPHGGWVASMIHHSSADLPAAIGEHPSHGSFLGMDPHKVMYYVSAVVGFAGIAAAFILHYAGRTSAATSRRADTLSDRLGVIARAARAKWYVDEVYDYLIRTPLWVLSHVFHLVDKLIVDGLVDLFGWLPRAFGRSIRPSQSGVLHGYAVGMAGGLAVILLIVLLVAW